MLGGLPSRRKQTEASAVLEHYDRDHQPNHETIAGLETQMREASLQLADETRELGLSVDEIVENPGKVPKDSLLLASAAILRCGHVETLDSEISRERSLPYGQERNLLELDLLIGAD